MKKTVILSLLISIAFVQCKKDKDPFMIKNGEIGGLSKNTQMHQLDSIFANDSIVKLDTPKDALETIGEVEVYDKKGKKLMLITPEIDDDSASKISYVQIFDNRYKTEKGLNSNSTFKDLKANYTVANVQTMQNAIIVFLKDSDIYVTVDKMSLPEEIRYNLESDIEVSQIPDTAPFKIFMIGWDHEKDAETEKK